MIPNLGPCYTVGALACPSLFDEMDQVLELALNTVRGALIDTPCGQEIEGFVSLNPVAVGEGNYVIVMPEPVVGVAPKSKSPLPQLQRTKITVMVFGVFNNFPMLRMVGDEALLPPPAEVHEATRFVSSMAWCTWCAIVQAIANGSLLERSIVGDTIFAESMALTDMDGGQAGFEIRLSWMKD